MIRNAAYSGSGRSPDAQARAHGRELAASAAQTGLPNQPEASPCDAAPAAETFQRKQTTSMKLKKTSGFLPLILSAIGSANATPIVRDSDADNLNLATAWVGDALPTTANTASWNASSTLVNTMGANNTWGALDTSAASGEVTISGNNTLTLDHTTNADTIFNTGANNFVWGAAGTGGAFHIIGSTPTASTTQGATFSGSGRVTISSTGTKNWSSQGSSNGVTQINFTGTLALRGATIPATGTLPGNWLALGGGGGDAANPGTLSQTGSFALDTGDENSCGALILTQGLNNQTLKLNSLRGTGSIRADWGIGAPVSNRTLELDQAGDTTLSGSILAHNGSGQRRNINFVKKGAGSLTLTGALGTSGGTASLNFDIQAGTIQLGDGTTNPAYQNAAGWDSASTFVVGSGATLRLKTSAAFTWSRAITGGSGTIEITTDGDPGDGNVSFTANNSAFTGNINLNAGSLRMGPNLGSGTLTVKTGSFVSVALPATNGTTEVGGLTLEGGTESDFRLGATHDKINVTGALTVPGPGETHTINIFNEPSAGGTVTLIDYSGAALTATEFSRITLGILPSLGGFELVNNTANTSIDLRITLQNQLWKGFADGNWDDTTQNWALESTPTVPAAFSFNNPAVFNDSAAITNVVVGAFGVVPLNLTFNNSAKAYTLTGGEITGTTALVKDGSNSVTLSQSNSYSGGTIVNAGVLVFDGEANNSSGGTTINGGTLRIGSGATTGDIGSGAVFVAAGASLEFNRSNTTPGVPDLDYKTNAKMRNVAGAGDIVLDGGLMFFNYTGTGVGFSEAGSWNNFSGNLTIKGGSEFQTIRNGATAMGTGDIILGDGTTSGALSQSEGNWTWTNDIILAGSDNRIRNRSLNAPRALKLQGVVSGAGGLTFEDPAAAMTDTNRGFILTNSNTLTGILTIATGTPLRVGGIPGNVDASNPGLPAGAAGTLGNATVVNNGTLTFSRTDAHAVGNAISGSGAVRVGIPAAATLGDTSTQLLTYTGTASHSGPTTLHNGTLIIDAGGSMGGSSVTVEAAATLGGTGTVNAPTAVDGTVAPGLNVGTLTVIGNTTLAGTLATQVDGTNADKLMVTGDLTLSGTLTVQEQGAGFTAASYVIAECTGAISGNLIAPNGYALSVSGKQLVLTKSAGTGFDQWIATFNVDSLTAIDDDPDNDGLDNGVEFILKGGNPAVAGGTELPVAIVSGGNLVFTFQRDDRARGSSAGVTIMVEAGPDLSSWPSVFSVATDTAGSTFGVTISNDTDSNPDTVTVTIPTDGAPEFFARLKVVETP
jgi:autotransporter-associated beta strand protein